MKPNKSGTGHYLQLTFQIIEGPYKNRFLWARLNLDNPNATAVQIARAELSARAIHLDFQDTTGIRTDHQQSPQERHRIQSPPAVSDGLAE